MRRSATRPPRSRSARLRESTMANRRKRSTSGKFTIGGPWELILVDGAHRLACLEAARDELRPNGVLLFDNADLEEYREASKLLPGFERRSFSGLGVCRRWTTQTDVYRRQSPARLTPRCFGCGRVDERIPNAWGVPGCIEIQTQP